MANVQTPRIRIPDPQQEIQKIFLEKVADIQKSFSFYNSVVIGVFLLGFLVLLFSLGTMIIQSWQYNSTFQAQLQQLKIQEDLVKNTVIQQKNIIDNQRSVEDKLKEIKDTIGQSNY